MERARSRAALLWSGRTWRQLAAGVMLPLALLCAETSPAQEVGGPELPGTEGPQTAAVSADSSGWFDAPTWVALRSLAIPGWGQAKNGDWIKALLVVAIEGACIERLRFEDRMVHRYRDKAQRLPSEADFYRRKEERHKNHRRDFIWWTSFVVILSMGDAYVGAHLRRFDVRLQAEPVLEENAGAEVGMRVSLAFEF